MIGERKRYTLAAAKARGIKLGNQRQAYQSGEGGPTGPSLTPAHRALHRGRPHVEQCDRSRSQRAASRRRMVVDGFRCRLAAPDVASALPPLLPDRNSTPGDCFV
jgi:hypothetical protein